MALWLIACGGDPEHPPNLPSGTGGNGGAGLVSGSGGSGGTGNSSSGGTTSCPSGPDPTLGNQVSGNIIVYDPTLVSKTPFAGNATVVMDGLPCGYVEADYFGGSGEYFVLKGAKPSDFNWAHFFQHTSGTEDVMPTLQAVYTKNAELTLIDEFAFVRATEIEALYQAAGVTPDPEKGTVLAQFGEAFGPEFYPLDGAIISTVGEAQIAYANGGNWELGTGPTDATGVAALVNAEALEFPGKSMLVHAEYNNVAYDFSAPVQAGGVTLIRFYKGD